MLLGLCKLLFSITGWMHIRQFQHGAQERMKVQGTKKRRVGSQFLRASAQPCSFTSERGFFLEQQLSLSAGFQHLVEPAPFSAPLPGICTARGCPIFTSLGLKAMENLLRTQRSQYYTEALSPQSLNLSSPSLSL